MSVKSEQPVASTPPPAGAKPKIQFLLHAPDDSVGVAVVDLSAGVTASGRALSGGATIEVPVLQDIPLGHKVALQDFQAGDTIIKYGVDIGKVVAPIKRGEHVHVHNLKTKRW